MSPDAEASETIAAWIWPGLVFGLLGLQVVLGVVSVILATGDPAWRVVPHYHERAIHWDQYAAQQQQSAHLGWKAAVSIGKQVDLTGQRELIVDLIDRDHQPVQNLNVEVELWHHARPGEVADVKLRPEGMIPGRYIGTAKIIRSGLWEVEIHAVRGSDQFDDRQRPNWQLAQN